MWTEKGDCCYAPWVCQWTSRKSAIRWPHCGNCINPRHYPKRWEKVALEFKRGVLLRDLPQLSSGNQPSVFTDQQCRQTSALRCVESGGRKKKDKSRNKTCFILCIHKPLAASESPEMMNFILICLLCGLYGVLAKGE